MDPRTFDRLVADAAKRTTRRSALRLLAGGLFAGAVAARVPRLARAQDDSDLDGLFDADETGVYGTNPGVFDSDGDGSSDGEEIYFGTNPLVNDAVAGDGNLGAAPEADPLVDPNACAPGLTSCNGQCRNLFNDPFNCATCGVVCPGAPSTICDQGVCYIPGVGPLVVEGTGLAPGPCSGPGAYCESDGQCCAGSLCCFSGVSLSTACTDVTATGGVCPGDTPLPAGGCGAGLIDCADGRGCIDPATDAFNCGACGNSCPLNGYCRGGVCQGVSCFDGTVDCGFGTCIDIQSDFYHCGACGRVCGAGTTCAGGFCVGQQPIGGGAVEIPPCDETVEDAFGDPPPGEPTCVND